MPDVQGFFDDTGNSGPVATAEGWAMFGAWLDDQDAEDYPAALHLWEQGWEDDLDALAAELEAADPDEATARDAAAELLDLVESRGAGDTALALALSEE